MHRYGVIGVSGDMDMFSLSRFIGVSWFGKPVCMFLESRRWVSSGLASRARCLGGEASYSGVASGVVSA